MKLLLALGGVVALAGGGFALALAFHSYSDHNHVDLFHLVVGTAMAVLSVVLIKKAAQHRV